MTLGQIAITRGVATCHRCKKRTFSKKLPDAHLWNCTTKSGYIVNVTCPDCLTDAENIEAEVNLATINYGTNAFGQVVGVPKGTS